MQYQKHFVDMIAKYVPEDMKMVDFISNLLFIGKEASYRRLRCEVEFSLSEVATIAKKLNINLTSLIIEEGGDKTTFNLRLFNDGGAANIYQNKIKADLNFLEGFQEKASPIFYRIGKSIPDIILFEYPNLTRLQLLKLQFNADSIQPSPFHEIEITDSIIKYQNEYWKKLQYFKLVFILEPNLLTSIINDISFFHELALISDKEKQMLKEELYDILDILNQSASTGQYKKKDISFYVSHITIDISYSLVTSKTLEVTMIDLNYPNSLLSFDKEISQAQMKRLFNIKKSSALITQSGELYKKSFLNKQKEKLNHL